MTRVFTIQLPMRMKINKHGELESLNLNVYRNLHFYKLNFQKKAFQLFVKPLLLGLPAMEAVTLHYEIYPKGGSRLDTMNVGSIVDKFFSDALVENGIIPDDDYKHVVGNSFSFGSLCPGNPHVLVTITETKLRKETPMRILLDQNEIQEALETYVKTMGLTGASGVELLLVGDEIQAEVLMDGKQTKSQNPNKPESVTETSDQPRKRGGRVPGSKNKPKGDTNVATDSETGNDLDSSGATDPGEEENSDLEDAHKDDSEDAGLDIFGESFDDGDEETDGTEPQESKAGNISRGNLFGDSDSEFSETTDPEDKTDSDSETEEQPVKKNTSGKRLSIFDAD